MVSKPLELTRAPLTAVVFVSAGFLFDVLVTLVCARLYRFRLMGGVCFSCALLDAESDMIFTKQTGLIGGPALILSLRNLWLADGFGSRG